MLYHSCFPTLLLGYAFRRVQARQKGLKLSSTHQLVVYTDYINVLYGSIHTITKKTAAFIVTTKEIGLEVNAKKTKCMVMSQDQHAGQEHNVQIGNKSIERVE